MNRRDVVKAMAAFGVSLFLPDKNCEAGSKQDRIVLARSRSDKSYDIWNTVPVPLEDKLEPGLLIPTGANYYHVQRPDGCDFLLRTKIYLPEVSHENNFTIYKNGQLVYSGRPTPTWPVVRRCRTAFPEKDVSLVWFLRFNFKK